MILGIAKECFGRSLFLFCAKHGWPGVAVCQLRSASTSVQLLEVGKLEDTKTGKYSAGQLFVHRIFGYRGAQRKYIPDWCCCCPNFSSDFLAGVILFPWIARLFDRDISAKKDGSKSEFKSTNGEQNNNAVGVGKDVKGKRVSYYQVLIDARDCPFIRTQAETVTFLGHQESSRSLYAIPGYVHNSTMKRISFLS